MICPNCGTNNEDTYQFCMKCGKPLKASITNATESSINIEQEVAPDQPVIQQSSGKRKKDLLKEKIKPAEGEVSVRTYYCTYYISRLLGLEAWGYLGVTNKRVIFQALGTSNAGSSVIQSELPIADVSGISSYKGTFFSFGHMALAFIISSIVASNLLFFMILFGTGLEIAIANIFKDSPGISGLGLGLIGWLLGVGCFIISLLIARNLIWRSILAAASSVGFFIAVGGGLFGMVGRGGLFGMLLNFAGASNNNSIASGGLAAVAFLCGFISIIYTLFCIVWYARRPTFAIAISSKGGSDTPISISGASGWGIFNVSAGKALTAEPARDVEPMLQELGAVILDIQMLGDMGIDKWKAL
jgi:hypothetical protein